MLCTVWGFAAVAVLMVSYYLAVEERQDQQKMTGVNKHAYIHESMQKRTANMRKW